MPSIVTTEFHKGQTLETPNGRITPFSKITSLTFPGFSGGLIWNRPSTVLIEDETGDENVLPVVDVTRKILWMIFGLAAGFAILSFFPSKKSNR